MHLLGSHNIGCVAPHGRRAGPVTIQPVCPRANRLPVTHIKRKLAEASAIIAAVAVLVTPPSAYAEVLEDGSSGPQTATCQATAREARGTPANPLAELSGGFFGGGGEPPVERDPITPFTIYGTNFKKYLIEQLQGEKIVSRKKGFTVETCSGAVPVTQETPQFQGLPTGDKALYAKERVCRKSEGQDLKETCRASCEASCTETVELYGAQVTSESGFALLEADKKRLERSCSRNCAYECVKPGKAFDFVIPYRR